MPKALCWTFAFTAETHFALVPFPFLSVNLGLLPSTASVCLSLSIPRARVFRYP